MRKTKKLKIFKLLKFPKLLFLSEFPSRILTYINYGKWRALNRFLRYISAYESEMKNCPDDGGNDDNDDDEKKEDDDDYDDSGDELPAMTRKRRRGLSRYAPRL